MKTIRRRRDTEALIEGRPIPGDADLDDVEAFLSAMRVEFGATPAPAPRPTLAATLDGRRELRPASAPRPKLTFPAPRPHPRLRPVMAVFATGAVLFGGFATAGALPGPVQRTTAELGSHVGIHLPDGRDTQPPSGGDVEPGTGRSDPPAPSQSRPATSPTMPAPNPSAAPTTPPTVELLPTPTIPTAPTLPIPNLGSLPEPLPPLVGLPGSILESGVIPGHPIP